MKIWGLLAVSALVCLMHSNTLNAQKAPVQTLVDVSSASASYSAADTRSIDARKKNNPRLEWIVPVKINLAALKSDEFTAFLNDQYVLIRKGPRRSGEDSSIWSGDVWSGHVILPGDHPDHKTGGMRDVNIFVTNNGRLFGYIHIDQDVYNIVTLPSGKHILQKSDTTIVIDHGQGHDVMPNPELQGKSMPVGGDPDVMDTIRVVIGFTPNSQEGRSLTEFVADTANAVNRANESFKASNILLRIEIAAYARPNYTETTVENAYNDLFLLSNGHLWLVHFARDQEYADVVAMVIENDGNDVCGLAPLGSTRSTAFMALRKTCYSDFTLSHEFGHLLSAHHNPEDLDGQAPIYPYGHGFRWQRANKGSATIMALTSSLPNYFRVNRWSNPDGFYLGSVTGTVEPHDNARVLRHTKSTVAAFYPDPPNGSASQSTVPILRLNLQVQHPQPDRVLRWTKSIGI